jgi:NAD(P)-dependent dehydrogenase (short-subunit alcohol dehydrogenase family)
MDVIAVVTGASRGAGKGIAIALGETGATVYVTGRSTADGDSPYGGTVTETADLITRAGGRGVAIALDHTDDEAVAALFARVKGGAWSPRHPGQQCRQCGRKHNDARRLLGKAAGGGRSHYRWLAFAFRVRLLCCSSLDR